MLYELFNILIYNVLDSYLYSPELGIWNTLHVIGNQTRDDYTSTFIYTVPTLIIILSA